MTQAFRSRYFDVLMAFTGVYGNVYWSERQPHLAYISWLSKHDAVDSRDVILEMANAVKNQALRLADQKVTLNPPICGPIFQVNTFDVFHHVRDAAEGAGALLVQIPFVANPDHALGLVADERKVGGREERFETWTLFLHRSFLGWRGPWLLSLLP
jgi:hypothetical protein